MTEQAPQGFDARSREQDPVLSTSESTSESATDPARTGVASVDAVLEDLAGIDQLPLEEHVAAFERAHESLRSALDAVPDALSDVSPGDLA